MPKQCFLLQSDTMQCAHNGIINAQSSIPQSNIKGIPMLNTADIANATISGCTHAIYAGNVRIPKPCTKIINASDCAFSGNANKDGINFADAFKIGSLQTDNNASVLLFNTPIALQLNAII